jgi:L-lactate dehydrogenase (cytochrome)
MRVARPPAPYGVRALDRCFSIEDLARLARRRLPSGARAYLEGGGEGEYTLRRNRAAFDEIELIPRVLTDVSDVDTRTEVLGSRAALPIVLAPLPRPPRRCGSSSTSGATAARPGRRSRALVPPGTARCCSASTRRCAPSASARSTPG